MAGWTPNERAKAAAALPLNTLGAVLGRDARFMDAVAVISTDAQSVDELARRYAPKAGRGRSVIAHMLLAASREPNRIYAQLRLSNLTPSIWTDVPPDDGDPQRWRRRNALYLDAADRIARRGAGFCLSRDCPTEVPGRRLWCSVHGRQLAADRQSAERSMRTLLDASARALGI